MPISRWWISRLTSLSRPSIFTSATRSARISARGSAAVWSERCSVGKLSFIRGRITADGSGRWIRPNQESRMHHLGETRSASHSNHALFTPDTFVRAPLPGMRGATAIVHTSPAMGASFTQYTAEFEPGGATRPVLASQRFVYVLEGELTVTRGFEDSHASKGAATPICPKAAKPVAAAHATRAVVIEKAYRPLPGTEPPRAPHRYRDVRAGRAF